jgi:hypothetical protein
MRITAATITLAGALALAGGSAAWTAPPASAPGQPLVITADHVRQAHGVATWTGHITVSGTIDPARTAVTLDGRPAPHIDLTSLPPLALAKLTNQGRGKARARLDLTTKR